MEGSGHVIPVLGLLGGPVVGHVVHADGPSLDLRGRAVRAALRAAANARQHSGQHLSSTNLDPIEVIHSQDGASLVLIAQEAEALGLPGLLVPHEVDVDDLAIPVTHTLAAPAATPAAVVLTAGPGLWYLLREHADDIALRQLVVQPACGERGGKERVNSTGTGHHP